MTTAQTHLDPARLQDLLGSGLDVRVLDVRTPAEYETAHTPGSYNVPLDTLANTATTSPPTSMRTSCWSAAPASEPPGREDPGRGRPAHRQGACGQHAGLGTVGADVVRGGTRWELERQVRLVAGTLVLIGVVVPGGSGSPPRSVPA